MTRAADECALNKNPRTGMGKPLGSHDLAAIEGK